MPLSSLFVYTPDRFGSPQGVRGGEYGFRAAAFGLRPSVLGVAVCAEAHGAAVNAATTAPRTTIRLLKSAAPFAFCLLPFAFACCLLTFNF
jgi:hypothetical protein